MARVAGLPLLLLVLLLPACYHMRVDPEPIRAETVSVGQPPAEALRRIREALHDELNLRALEDEDGGNILVTSPWHFATDTGFGQPPGGRKNLVQFRIEAVERAGRTEVTVAPYNYEIRTSYAYGLDGQVRTLYKAYPYEQYPGMFDVDQLRRELERVAAIIRRACTQK